MKKIFLFLMPIFFTACSNNNNGSADKPAIPYDENLEKKVTEIVSNLSIDDKIGQMCQVTVDVILQREQASGIPIIDESKLDTVIDIYRVGSILNTPYGHAHSKEEWYKLISAIQEKSIDCIGIPDVYGVDQNHGVTYTKGGTLFPQEINMAASFNKTLVREGAEICAYETRACGIPWVFNPVMDLGRNPAWSRIWESFGEDPYVNGAMAVEMVRGYQGGDANHIGVNNVGACLKHYMAYGNPVSGKDRTPSSINPIDLREKYFQPYKMAIQAGALSIMVSSGINNGLPTHANHELLTVWLKEGLNWDGMIVTDWADIHNLWKRDKIASDYKEAIMKSVNAGIDMSMTPYDTEFCTLLKELVEEGKVKMERIDDAVKRIIRFKLRLGLYETPVTNPINYPDFASNKFAEKALELAVESEILLKNNANILPLSKGKKILVTGPNANSMRSLNGGWSYTWQGTEDSQYHEAYNTIYQALCNEFGTSNVILEQGMDYVENYGQWEKEENMRIEKAVSAARNCDIIIACVGENSYCETPGNTNDLQISVNQSKLIESLSKTGKPIILVLNEGRPRIIREIEPMADAIVDILLPGNYGGDALALLLSGKRNFSGKLPYTYPKWHNAIATYDHKPSETVMTMDGSYSYSADIDIQWPFGYGLSYTTFSYENISIDKSEFNPNEELTISVDVKNTGNIEGQEAIILYSSDLVASITPDVRRVRAFDKVRLSPGETKKIEFKIPASDLAFVNYDGKWTLEEGIFEFIIGDKKIQSKCSETNVWSTQNI